MDGPALFNDTYTCVCQILSDALSKSTRCTLTTLSSIQEWLKSASACRQGNRQSIVCARRAVSRRLQVSTPREATGARNAITFPSSGKIWPCPTQHCHALLSRKAGSRDNGSCLVILRMAMLSTQSLLDTRLPAASLALLASWHHARFPHLCCWQVTTKAPQAQR